MRIKAKLVFPTLDRAQVSKAMDIELQRVVRTSAAAFYRAVWTRALPHVDTGMMQGSLIPLGRYLKNVPTSFSSEGSPERPQKHYPRGKSQQAGIAIGEDMFRFDATAGKYEFHFYNRIFHWKINEIRHGWAILEAGVEAFRAELQMQKAKNVLSKIIKDNIRYSVKYVG